MPIIFVKEASYRTANKEGDPFPIGQRVRVIKLRDEDADRKLIGMTGIVIEYIEWEDERGTTVGIKPYNPGGRPDYYFYPEELEAVHGRDANEVH